MARRLISPLEKGVKRCSLYRDRHHRQGIILAPAFFYDDAQFKIAESDEKTVDLDIVMGVDIVDAELGFGPLLSVQGLFQVPWSPFSQEREEDVAFAGEHEPQRVEFIKPEGLVQGASG